MSGKQTSPENPHKYGTPEFGHWRTQQKLLGQARQTEQTARQARRQVEANDAAFSERMAEMAAEKSADESRRKAEVAAQLEPERVRRRRQYLIEHADLSDAGYVFDAKVWPLLKTDLLDQQQLEQVAESFRSVGYGAEKATARAREILNERQRKAAAT